MGKSLDYIKRRFSDCFDVKYREIEGALGKTTLVFIDNLCSTEFISDYIVSPIKNRQYVCKDLDELITNVLEINLASYVKNKRDLDDAMLHILSGDVVIFVEGYEDIIYCEAKGFVRRGIGIPETEAVVKGPREGFNELFVDNISLIRRKIKNPDLKFEPIYVGNKSQTVVCLGYIKGVAKDELIKDVKNVVKNLDAEFLLDTNYVEDKLKDSQSVFDTVGYSEKPDEVASKIMEGRIAVLVDGTPFVITVPYFFLENFQAPDDYYLNRKFANFTRVLRWIAFFLATFLPAIYVAMVTYHFGLIPSLFLFRLAVSRAGIPFPTIVEVLIMMLTFQIIKEAGLRLPQPIGSAMSIVSGLILGEAAVGAGIASRITVIVVSLSMISYFLIPKLYSSVTLSALTLVIISSLFGLPGVFVAMILFFMNLADLNSMGYSYLFPIGSKENYSFRDTILRGKLDRISRTIVREDGKNEKENK